MPIYIYIYVIQISSQLQGNYCKFTFSYRLIGKKIRQTLQQGM